MKLWVVITAAGASRRMGANKMLLTLLGEPVLVHTMRRFQLAPEVDGFLLSAPPGEEERYRELGSPFSKLLQVVTGGAERQDSIRNALEALVGQAEDVVAIHDGARPLFPASVLRAGKEAMLRWEGALPMVAVKDTIKRVGAQGQVLETLQRSELYAAQTPQFFRLGRVLDAHRRAHQEGFLGTDDASLLERLGGTVGMLAGDYRNLKITTPEDLPTAEAWLKEGSAHVSLPG